MISDSPVINTADSVLETLVTIEYQQGPDPLPGASEAGITALLTTINGAGGNAVRIAGDASTQVCVAKRTCVYLGGGPACLEPGDTDSNGDNLADSCGSSVFSACDVNQDSVIDVNDINLIFSSRNLPAPAGDPRDVDGDRLITANDARICTQRCTKPNCAP